VKKNFKYLTKKAGENSKPTQMPQIPRKLKEKGLGAKKRYNFAAISFSK
jgi:hypothetical protein